jgi:hypothetical protein
VLVCGVLLLCVDKSQPLPTVTNNSHQPLPTTFTSKTVVANSLIDSSSQQTHHLTATANSNYFYRAVRVFVEFVF